MWPFRKKDEPTRLTIDEYLKVWEVARTSNQIELGIIPQTHLKRDDMLKRRRELELEGQNAMGRPVVSEHFRDDPDLTARDD